MDTIYDFVKTQRTNYRTQTIEVAEGYEFSQYQTLRTIELYHNSKFTTGIWISCSPLAIRTATMKKMMC